MKLKNITKSDKELTDIYSGERIIVKAGKTIQLLKANYNPNAFVRIGAQHNEKDEQINIKREVE